MKIPIAQIKIGNRYRKDMGDIDELATSIAELGLLQPIGIAPDDTLIFGERRLRACRDVLGLAEIEARVIDMPSIVVGENAENEVRKDFTPSERVAIARAIADELGNRQGSRTDKKHPQNIAEVERGQETRDFAAKKAGFGNRETFRQAESVVNTAEPEIVEAMDSGKLSILASHKASKLPPEEQREVAKFGYDTGLESERKLKDQYAGHSPQVQYQSITNAIMVIAACGISADEFLSKAPRPTIERCRRSSLAAMAFLKNLTEVSNDTQRAS